MFEKFAKLLWATLNQRPQVLKSFQDVLPQRAPRTLFQFDQQVTAPLGGYPSAVDYYQRFSTLERLPEIRRPTLVITAKDDPLIPFEVFANVDQAGAVTLIATEHGGHLGFVSRGDDWPETRQMGTAGVPVPRNRWVEWAMIHALQARLGCAVSGN